MLGFFEEHVLRELLFRLDANQNEFELITVAILAQGTSRGDANYAALRFYCIGSKYGFPQFVWRKTLYIHTLPFNIIVFEFWWR